MCVLAAEKVAGTALESDMRRPSTDAVQDIAASIAQFPNRHFAHDLNVITPDTSPSARLWAAPDARSTS
jgi:hypothetical protein